MALPVLNSSLLSAHLLRHTQLPTGRLTTTAFHNISTCPKPPFSCWGNKILSAADKVVYFLFYFFMAAFKTTPLTCLSLYPLTLSDR